MSDVIETDLTTDPPTVTERDFTPQEAAQREEDAKAQEAEKKAKAKADAVKKPDAPPPEAPQAAEQRSGDGETAGDAKK